MDRRSVLLMGGLLAVIRPWPARAGTDTALRVSGSPGDAALIDQLWRGYRAGHPRARLATSLHGPESTLAGVYTGTADIALMARETREPMERMAFQWALLTPPFEIEIATAGIAADRPNAQLGVFVHAANPCPSITLAQLDAVLGAERLRAGAPVASWGDIGVSGGWAQQVVHAYAAPVETIDALYIRRLVMKDSRKWRADLRAVRDEAAVIAAIATDRTGIGVAPLRLATSGVRVIAVEGVAPDSATIVSRRYPLSRAVRMVMHRPKDGAIDADVADFLHFVLSPAGQAVIASDATYLPLTPALIAIERAKLP